MTTREVGDVVSGRLVEFRKAARMTREDLAERCQQLGSDLTVDALANIETGRRDGDGRRRRRVTVDELVIFAAVFAVPLEVFVAAEHGDGETLPRDTAGATEGQPVGLLGAIQELTGAVRTLTATLADSNSDRAVG